MLAWMLYVAMVTLLLSGAALAAERTSRLQRAPTRWIWALTIVASLLLPTVIASVSIQVPNVFTPAVSERLISIREVTSQRLSPASWIKDGSGSAPEWRNLDPLLKRSWKTVSAGMLLVLAATGAHLFLRKRRWVRDTVNGTPVYVTPDIGPAVVGLLRPRIVVPAWVMQSPHDQQTMVMAHEQSHLDAHDPQLLTIALCLLVIMPWNLPLWWQLRRLRYAIEVDCDARVLQGGHDLHIYGETLIAVGQRQSAFIGSVAAMSESRSFLEERIRILVLKPSKRGRIVATGLACLSLGMLAVAAQVGPPNAPGSTADHRQVFVDPRLLDGYVGTYKLDFALLRITRDGPRLFAQMTGEEIVEIIPESDSDFFCKIYNARISFIKDAPGHAGSLILRQNGKNAPAPRIEASEAQQIEKTLAEKIRLQQPTPGSDAALHRIIDGLIAGRPNYNEMSPDLADAVRQQLPQLQLSLVHVGAVQSMTFNGVGNRGWDIFIVRHENGVTMWSIDLRKNGTIGGAVTTAGLL